MNIDIINGGDIKIAVITSDNIIINNTQDALDIMANSTYQGAYKIIVYQKNIHPDFFDLKTGLAGDILQKFSTYRVQLAIVGDFSIYLSKSLKDFIFESNKMGHINFVDSLTTAKEILSRSKHI